jgi:type IV pilus assembly protein PilB
MNNRNTDTPPPENHPTNAVRAPAAKIGHLLVQSGEITPEQLDTAISLQLKNGNKRLGTILVDLDYIDKKTLATHIAKQYNLPFLSLSEVEVDPSVVDLVPASLARKFVFVPLFKTNRELIIATADPSDISTINNIEFMTGLRVVPRVAEESDILATIDQHCGQEADALGGVLEDVIEVLKQEEQSVELVHEEAEVGVEELRKATEDAPIVKLANFLLIDAIGKGASDIHVEPYEDSLRVRFRIDGILRTVMNPPKHLHPALVSRLKVMCELDIAERRRPQDGRLCIMYKKRAIDFRVSFLPGLFGEKVVARILDKANLMLDMTHLGFERPVLDKFTRAIESPYGMVLVTGPTGSGKTTTLYSALDSVNKEGVNIMTAEDPVEFNLKGINQINVKEKIGLTFANALRSFLRQDPDIIMVGEVRDLETAEIAIKAALTGHLVFSTLHTNDAPSTVTRLLNMGIEPLLVASSLVIVVAQRLARRICTECKEPVTVPKEALLQLGFQDDEIDGLTVFKGKGCSNCGDTGYKGRVALYEVMELDEGLKELILQNVNSQELTRAAVEHGMDTLRMAGIKKIKEGMTTIEEVLRVTTAL